MYTVCTLKLGMMPTCCYLVYTEGEKRVCAVVDPACDAPAIRRKARALGLKIGAVLLTHGHFDHTGAVEDLASENIPVYLSSLDRPMLTDPEKNGSSAFGFSGAACRVKTCDVKDGDEIRVGNMIFTVIHTPGHTPGSVCYMFDGGMFTGDTMFANGYGRTDLWGGSFQDMVVSLRRLMPLRNNNRIYPGHDD